MSIIRYRVDRDGMLHESNTGLLIRVCDHWKEVDRLQKIIDEQNATINAQNVTINAQKTTIKGSKPKDDDKFVASYRVGNTPIKDTISYKNLQSYLNLLSNDDNYEGLTICALRPVKVVEKKTLTVEL